jgi:hypothetical protein
MAIEKIIKDVVEFIVKEPLYSFSALTSVAAIVSSISAVYRRKKENEWIFKKECELGITRWDCYK